MIDEGANEDAIREERIRRIMRQVEEKLRRDLKQGVRPLSEIEREVEEIGESIKEAISREAVDECGSGYIGARATCRCGGRARFAGLRARRIIARHGLVEISRAFYHCRACRSGFCPLDGELELGAGRCSRTVQELMARFSCHLPFAMAAQELETVCGIRVSAATVQRYAERIGARIERDWETREKEVASNRARASAERPKRLHVSMDGAFAHIGGDWREVKLAAVYQRGERGRVHSARYYGTVECSEKFGPKARALAHCSGADRCADIQVVADGAPWVWQEAGKHFPRSVQTLDFYHASQHLSEAAEARYGEGAEEAKVWLKHLKGLLLDERAEEAVGELAAWRPRKSKSRAIQRRLIAYLRTHRHRMNYRTLREQGCDIGSGVMEAGCKTVVKRRLAGSGMRWGRPGAQAMVHLCAHWRSKDGGAFRQYTN